MKENFIIKDLGFLKYFLGIDIVRSSKGLLFHKESIYVIY
jgi:hypothetical protein